MSKMTLSQELEWRGFINQTTLDDIKELDTGAWVFYKGFDASADSQTIGNLAAMMMDMVFIRHGHQAIILAGGATSLIGDPGGKDAERTLQSEETVRANVAKAEEQIRRVYGQHDFTLVNNLDWFKNITVLGFLRDIGKHFGMSTLVQRDYIQQRIGEGGSGMSYTEFSYTLMQGYDFLHLSDEYGVNLQLAGSDQWGNCLSGVDLVRKARSKTVHAITLPLILNKATGKKFGKTEDGAVWLDPARTSAFDFYQFWLNVDDEGVAGYLKIYTMINPDEYATLMDTFEAAPHERTAQRYLADTVTRLVHGDEKAEQVARISGVLFDDRNFSELSADDIGEMKGQLPQTTEHTVVKALIDSGLVGSKSEARRTIEQGAVSLNSLIVTTDQEVQLTSNGAALLRRGKNKFALVV